ncbi:MAG: alpha/beta hydrolase [Calditrichaeota bacterium]|nr:MAG: alpha/beta hydrolase [Calditrichota bacterium]MBL1208045.1 alpha/beta hydrolase [Calditrichota bacterium]NOG47880.1 alpha/beta hydrolase [Calditrichota bacterium]
MLFITNRVPTKNTEPELNKEFEFDLENNSSSRAFFCCRRSSKKSIEEIGSMTLLSAIKNSNYKHVLMYIHGFSTLPEDVFNHAKELQSLCDNKKDEEILVIPIIWPCDNDIGIIKDYWDDQKAADQSAFSLARMLQKFMEWRSSTEYNPDDNPCLKRINILAHSMGNRVLRQTLSNWHKYDQPGGLPLLFRNTFLVAADILNESLHKGHEGELISHTSRNVVIYYASDDLALRASKVSNLKNAEASRRLGHSGPEDLGLTPKNVYAVDCDEVNTTYDYPKGHSYFRSGKKKGEPGIVFDHIFNTLLNGRVFPKDEFRKTSILTLADSK